MDGTDVPVPGTVRVYPLSKVFRPSCVTVPEEKTSRSHWSDRGPLPVHTWWAVGPVFSHRLGTGNQDPVGSHLPSDIPGR